MSQPMRQEQVKEIKEANDDKNQEVFERNAY